MSTTYTPPTGLTPQGQGVDALTSSIQSITGGFPLAASLQASQQAGQMQANLPTVKAQEQVGLSDKFQMPQSTDYYGKIVDMYLHDKSLNNQYQGNIGATPITTMPGTDVVSAVPRLTQDNLNQPFSGFTDPVKAAQAGEQEARVAFDTLANLSKLIDANYTKIGKQFDVDMSAYESSIKQKRDDAQGYLDLYKELASQGLSKKDILTLGLQGAAVGKKLDLSNPNNPKWIDASDQSPDEIADQFMGGQMKWADVPDSVKPYVTKIVKNRGSTVDKVNKAYESVDNSITTLDKIISDWTSMSDVQKHLPSGLVTQFPFLAPKRAALQTLFMTNLEPSMRSAIVGGRITQQEIKWIRDAMLPTATDSYESALAKLNAVRYGLEQKRQNPQYIIGPNTFKESQSDSTKPVILRGPDGTAYKYDSTSDPDYIADLKSGYKPV